MNIINPGVNENLTTELNVNFNKLYNASIAIQSVQDELLSEVNRLNTHFSRPALSLTTASTSGVVSVTVENTALVSQFNTSFNNLNSNITAGYLRSTEIDNDVIAINTDNGSIPPPVSYSYIKGTEEFDVYIAGVDTTLSSKLNNGFSKLNTFNSNNTKMVTEAITQVNAIAVDESLSGYSSTSVTLQTPGATGATKTDHNWSTLLPDFDEIFSVRAPQREVNIEIAYKTTGSVLVWGKLNLQTLVFTEYGSTAVANLITDGEITTANSSLVNVDVTESDRNFIILDDGGMVYDRKFHALFSDQASVFYSRLYSAIRRFNSNGTAVYSNLSNLIQQVPLASSVTSGTTPANLLSGFGSLYSSFAYVSNDLVCFAGNWKLTRNSSGSRWYVYFVLTTFNTSNNSVSNSTNYLGEVLDSDDTTPYASYYYLTNDAFYTSHATNVKVSSTTWRSVFRAVKITHEFTILYTCSQSQGRTTVSQTHYQHLNMVSSLMYAEQSGSTYNQQHKIYVEGTEVLSYEPGTASSTSPTSSARLHQNNGTEFFLQTPSGTRFREVDIDANVGVITDYSDLYTDASRNFWVDTDGKVKQYLFDTTTLSLKCGSFTVDNVTDASVTGIYLIDFVTIMNPLFELPEITYSNPEYNVWTNRTTEAVNVDLTSNYFITNINSPIIIYEVN